jgi:hypothetical protein
VAVTADPPALSCVAYDDLEADRRIEPYTEHVTREICHCLSACGAGGAGVSTLWPDWRRLIEAGGRSRDG